MLILAFAVAIGIGIGILQNTAIRFGIGIGNCMFIAIGLGIRTGKIALIENWYWNYVLLYYWKNHSQCYWYRNDYCKNNFQPYWYWSQNFGIDHLRSSCKKAIRITIGF